jgi:hypothetical protein
MKKVNEAICLELKLQSKLRSASSCVLTHVSVPRGFGISRQLLQIAGAVFASHQPRTYLELRNGVLVLGAYLGAIKCPQRLHWLLSC